MDMNAVGLNTINSSQPTSGGSNVDAQINALRQKLQYLNTQKQKAKQAHNTEKAKKLEHQIKQIRQKIQQLERKRSSNVEKTDSPDENSSKGLMSFINGERNSEPGLGRFVDMFI